MPGAMASHASGGSRPLPPSASTATVVALLPARLASSRFPNKPLAAETGKPMIQHAHERAAQARSVQAVAVATSDHVIFETVQRFGGIAIMTRDDHPNGTSRIAEAVRAFPAAEVIVNVQGDEPEIDPAHIDLAVDALLQSGPEVVASTLATPFAADDDPADPNLVKVLVDRQGRALMFTRNLIPWDRERGKPISAVPRIGKWSPPQAQATGSLARTAPRGTEGKPTSKGSGPWADPGPYRHVGLYVYRREFLVHYVSLPPTPLEELEALEQLRILEHGHRMAVAVTEVTATGIDTPAQYAAFVQRFRAQTRSR